MQLSHVGLGAFFCVSLAVGARLVWLGLRGRGGAPALLIGLGVLGIGPIGFGLQALALSLRPGATAEGLATAGAVAVAIGLWAKLAFNCTVYRRGSRVALAATLALGLAVAAHLLYQPFTGSFLAAAHRNDLAILRGSLQVAVLGWGAWEALAFWTRLRKRLRLGLADPLVASRMLLWGVSAGAAGLGTAIGVVYSALTGIPSLESPAILASSSAHGLVAALAMWLAFVPPRAYERWLARSHVAA